MRTSPDRSAKIRTSADRTAEVLERFQGRSLTCRRDLVSDRVMDAHDRQPLGPHDDQTARLLRALRGAPVRGKHVVFSLGADGPWCIGVITIGCPGNLLLEEREFDTYEDAMREVFRLRCLRLRRRDQT
jgi:hypothetical protein